MSHYGGIGGCTTGELVKVFLVVQFSVTLRGNWGLHHEGISKGVLSGAVQCHTTRELVVAPRGN